MRNIITVFMLIIAAQLAYSQSNTDINEKSDDMENLTPKALMTCIYKVGDLNKAKEWYSKAFDTKPYFDEPFYIGFNIGGYELGLLPEENPTTDKAEGVLAYWGVDDIQKVYDHMIASGATEHENPTNVGDPIWVASVKDPWGNIIGLIYNPVFKLEK
jgi:predicted enzyme related to lactoylglutathione lyase